MAGPRFEVYVDHAGEHRWTLVAVNGEKIADSAEGYETRDNVLRAIGTVRDAMAEATIEVRG